jgi:hypothetical protein
LEENGEVIDNNNDQYQINSPKISKNDDNDELLPVAISVDL